MLAMQRDESLAPLLEQALADSSGGGDMPLPETVERTIMASGGADRRARRWSRAGRRKGRYRRLPASIRCPTGQGKTALITVAEATAYRQR